jgi:3-dehydroquinate synthase class II
MKKALIVIGILGMSVSMAAQSLVDLAKKEKERRESYRGRHAVVIRNIDLLRVKKLPSVQVGNPDEAADEVPVGEGQDVEPVTFPADYVQDREQAEYMKSLEAQLKAATEQVDLLTTKMNALRQQFEAQDAMVPGYVIQQQLDETSQRLVKAQAQLARIQAEIDKKSSGKKEPGAVER